MTALESHQRQKERVGGRQGRRRSCILGRDEAETRPAFRSDIVGESTQEYRPEALEPIRAPESILKQIDECMMDWSLKGDSIEWDRRDYIEATERGDRR